MKQLGILDSAFINLEHATTPQHIGGMGIYDPSTAPGSFVRFKDVIARFEQKLNKLPLFSTRLVQVPGGHDKPYWVKDANFDVEFHLRHIALPQPGDWRQLCILIARLHARPLDMNRPLWEAYIIEGLDNISNLPKGCFAVYTKMHHALVDGSGGASFMSALHDLEPDPVDEIEDETNEIVTIPDRQPSAIYMRTNALLNRVKNYSSITRGSLGLGKELSRTLWGMAKGTIPAPQINAPKCRFNRPVGPYRVFEAALLELDGFKKIKNAANCKVNDVAMAVIAGGMRKYLEHYNELPAEPLNTGIPLNMRTRRGETNENNQLGSVFACLHTNIEDPMERLKAIHKSANEAKEFGENNPMVDTLKMAGLFSPRLTSRLVQFYINNKLTERLPVGISTVISNVPGPNFPLYSCGAKLVQYHGLGLLTPGVGLFHLVFSYCGTVTITIVGDRDIMPDPAFYRQCIEDSYKELIAASDKKTKKVVRRKKAASSKSTASSKTASTPKTASSAKTAAKTRLNVVAKETTTKEKESSTPADSSEESEKKSA